MNKETSTVGYVSNLQYIDHRKENDVEYMKHVHDPFALEKMQELIKWNRINYTMTRIQTREMKDAAGHCAFAFKDDYPWGTIIIDGERKVVCKCINTECQVFNQCRRGASAFDEKELDTDSIGIKPVYLDTAFEQSFAIGEQFKNELLGQSSGSNEQYDTLKISEIFGNQNGETDTIEDSIKGEDDDIDESVEGVKSEEDILNDFEEWLLSDKKIKNVKAYSTAIKNINTLTLKKGIWKDSIYYPIDGLKYSEHAEIKACELKSSKIARVINAQQMASIDLFVKFYFSIDGIIDNTVTEITDTGIVDGTEKNSFEKFQETPQETVIESGVDERLIVNAGPGTGKTYTLIKRIINLVNTQDIDPEEILVLCFSRATVEVIEKRLYEAYLNDEIGMNWNAIDIRTFDSFATHLLIYIEKNEKELLSKGFSLNYLDYDERIKAATEVIEKDNSLIEQCTHLIVDEVQDLVASRAKFVIQMVEALPETSGYTLLGDACQAIYDYQIQPGELDSTKFYKWLFETQKNSKFYSFGINYRQVSELESLGNEYRQAILVGNENDRKKTSNKIFNSIESLNDINLYSVELEELEELVGDKTLGILTRTNGQALKISTWFRNSEIPHKVQKRLTDNALHSWIADVFINYENDTVDKDEFIEMFSNLGIFGYDPEDVWDAIENTQYEGKNRYYVKDLLAGIKTNGKSKEFYTMQEDQQIVVSNIHRSKGREFDNVVLLDDTLLMDKDMEKDIQEHKVSYVAVTRAKEKIYHTSIGNQYIKTDKNGERRAYATGLGFRKKKPYLSHIEIGRNYDLDELSFALDPNIQERFDEPMFLVGERVKLVKNKEYSKQIGYVTYDILLEDDMTSGAFGCTSKKFYLDLKRILKEIYKLPSDKEVYIDTFPNRFSEIYIEDVISVIGENNPEAVAAKQFGDVMVWKGITLVGFAQIEKDTY